MYYFFLNQPKNLLDMTKTLNYDEMVSDANYFLRVQ